MNPIIVNNESYFQFTMKRNSVPTSAAITFSSIWDYQRKKVTMGKDVRGRQTQKGMVCLQIERPSPASTNGWCQHNARSAQKNR